MVIHLGRLVLFVCALIWLEYISQSKVITYATIIAYFLKP
jgi:hypothetical protein